MEEPKVSGQMSGIVVRRALIIGAVLGATATFAIYQLVKMFQGGESMIGFLLIIPSRIVFFPAARFAQTCDWIWEVSGLYQATMPMLLFAAGFNAIVSAAIGTVVGALIKLLDLIKRRRNVH